MAAFALTSEYLALNSTDVSAYVKSAVLVVDSAQLDSTTMGDSWTEVTGGLKSGTLTITFQDDLAAGALDATLWPLFGTNVTFEVRGTSSSVGASNPKWTGSVHIAQHAVGGGIGEMAQKSVTYPTTGTVTRATA